MTEAAPGARAGIPAELVVAFAALVLGAAAMGVSPLFVRFAAAEVGPFASAFWRVSLALPVLYLWMRLEGSSEATPRLFETGALLAGLAFAGDLFFCTLRSWPPRLPTPPFSPRPRPFSWCW